METQLIELWPLQPDATFITIAYAQKNGLKRAYASF